MATAWAPRPSSSGTPNRASRASTASSCPAASPTVTTCVRAPWRASRRSWTRSSDFAADGRCGARDLQRLPGAHRGGTAARGAAEEPWAHLPVPAHDADRGVDASVLTRAAHAGPGTRHPDQPLLGRLHLRRRDLRALVEHDQIVLRYQDNPNGSRDDIAGVSNVAGNVVGLMPHPERAMSTLLGSADGRVLLEGSSASASSRTDLERAASEPAHRVRPRPALAGASGVVERPVVWWG